MTSERFVFQRQVCAQFKGVVLDVGCNDDPAHLRGTYGERIIRIDKERIDGALGYAIDADYYFDAGLDTWPFEDDAAELVLFGDTLEHLYPPEAMHALNEARRVAPNLAVTVPNDVRVTEGTIEKCGSYHVVQVTETYLKRLLADAGWDVVSFQSVDYTFVEEGFFVLAKRVSPGTS
jgi:hypothetical protein